MKVALDTNVLVSGLLNPFGSSGEIVRMVASEELKICYDARILLEYKEVLLRPKFSFNPTNVNDLLVQIEACGLAVATIPLPKHLPDPDDEPFLEAGLAGKAPYLITGNPKHYPLSKEQSITIVSPTEFLEIYRTT